MENQAMNPHPLTPFLESQGVVLLDGGLSAELESMGHDLNHRLWTARFLDDHPEVIKAAHRANLEAGANCIISSSYQASLPGLIQAGYSPQKSRDLIIKSYHLATESRDDFYESSGPATTRLKPVVAASIGPYGAYLADGSEYRGDYGISVDELVAFHRGRFESLAEVAELLAIETIPSLAEAEALARLIAGSETPAWVSFSCKDGHHINDGHTINEAVSRVTDLPQVIAVGVNCTHPDYVSELIPRITACCGDKEVVVYPNSGERYCVATKTWEPNPGAAPLSDRAPEWLRLGARIIGGCCRVTAAEIATLTRALCR